MNIGFVFTNYNNTKYTQSVIESIRSVYFETNDYYEIVIVDNCSNEQELIHLKNLKSNFENLTIIFSKENLGYFKGLNLGISYFRNNPLTFNNIIIGNNDLLFSPNFISELKKIGPLFEKYPVISPDIITLENEHQNPHVIRKISKFREFIYNVYYSNYYISVLIHFIANKSKKITDRNDEKFHNTAMEIFQGHGSCYILGYKFFEKHNSLFAPTFLMNEEFFLAFQLKKEGQTIYYTPDIQVLHIGHASLSMLPSKKLWSLSSQSHKVYKKYLTLYNKI